jgi:hypothetical protein
MRSKLGSPSLGRRAGVHTSRVLTGCAVGPSCAVQSRTTSTPGNSSLPPAKGQRPNQPENAKRVGPRPGSLGRKGGGRPLACDPDETVTARPVACVHCQAVLTDADQMLHGRYDKFDLPVVRPMVTRVERYAGHCPCCGRVSHDPL